MSGRRENESRIEEAINVLLTGAPAELTVWNELMLASGLTAVTRRDRIQKIKAFLNGRLPSSITRTDVITYFGELRKKDITDTYRTSIWYTMSSFCAYLHQEGITPSNYMLGIGRSRNNDVHKPITVTAKSMSDIRDNVRADSKRYYYAGRITLQNRDLLMVAILIETGLRETALTSIDVSDIKLPTKSIDVVEKGGVVRTVYLSDGTLSILYRWLSDRQMLLRAREKETDALFVSRDGDRISHDVVRYTVRKYSDGKITPHGIRGGYCSVLYDQTHDIEFVRRAVGHAYASTTQRYIRTDGMESRKGMEIINKVL